MMRKLLPAPLLSLALLVMWLLLVRSYTLGQVLLGALAGWAMPWFVAMRPHHYWLQYAMLFDRFTQFNQRIVVKFAARLIWIGHNRR